MIRAITLIFLIGLSDAAQAISTVSTNQFSERLLAIEAQAIAGDNESQMFLARVYLEGYKSVKPDTEKGMYWLEKSSAERPEIQEYIGQIHHYGYYGERDFEQAFNWYLKAANSGYSSSMDYVGLFYSSGLGGLEQSCGEALQWYNKALETGYKNAKGNVVWILSTCPDKSYRNGDKAVKLALEVIDEKLHPEASDIDNLAAAYAEADNFEYAVKFQRQALALLEQKEGERALAFKRRLDLYLNGKKWRGHSNASPQDYSPLK